MVVPSQLVQPPASFPFLRLCHAVITLQLCCWVRAFRVLSTDFGCRCRVFAGLCDLFTPVHDSQDSNIFMDHMGLCSLGDLGSAVELNSPIMTTTLAFAPSIDLAGQPARFEYDWWVWKCSSSVGGGLQLGCSCYCLVMVVGSSGDAGTSLFDGCSWLLK